MSYNASGDGFVRYCTKNVSFAGQAVAGEKERPPIPLGRNSLFLQPPVDPLSQIVFQKRPVTKGVDHAALIAGDKPVQKLVSQ